MLKVVLVGSLLSCPSSELETSPHVLGKLHETGPLCSNRLYKDIGPAIAWLVEIIAPIFPGKSSEPRRAYRPPLLLQIQSAEVDSCGEGNLTFMAPP
jgi:hypothetical protein